MGKAITGEQREMFGGWKCRVCGCTQENCEGCVEKTGEPCIWISASLCSACLDEPGVNLSDEESRNLAGLAETGLLDFER